MLQDGEKLALNFTIQYQLPNGITQEKTFQHTLGRPLIASSKLWHDFKILNIEVEEIKEQKISWAYALGPEEYVQEHVQDNFGNESFRQRSMGEIDPKGGFK